MSHLLSLPVEILYYIVNAVNPDDIESFAASCKLIRKLSHAAIKQHRELQQKYGELVFGALEYTSCDALIFLREIVEDPRVAFYPKGLKIYDYLDPDDPDSDYDESDYKVDPEVKSVIASNGDEIRRLISGCSLISLAEGERWYQHISKGQREPIFALLLTLLPNLRSINLETDPLELDNEFRVMADRIACSYLQSQKKETLCLSKLCDVSQCGSDYDREFEYYEDMNTLVLFAALPSVKKITGNYALQIYDKKEDLLKWPYQAGISNVTELNFTYSTIMDDTLPNFLIAFHSLRKFKYSNGGWMGSFPTFEPRRILAGLRKYASHSLVHLHLTGEWIGQDRRQGDQGLSCDLTMFKELRTLHADFSLLLDPTHKCEDCEHACVYEHSAICPLNEVLPKSIEEVILEGQISDSRLSSLLLGLPSVQLLPNLRKLTIGSKLMKDATRKDAFNDVGVQLCYSDIMKDV